MKRWLIVAGLGLAFLFQECSTDFDLNADFKETPVIYALLSASDTVHYIRINRAFLDDEINAVTLAQDPGQIYYGAELTVTLEERSGEIVVNSFPVERVDGDTLGIPKSTDGIFASLPNILYRFKADLNADHSYKITVTNTETGITAYAETEIVDPFDITRPNDESSFPQSVSLSIVTPYQFRWETGQDARFYDLSLRFHYRDRTFDPLLNTFTTVGSGELIWKFEDAYTAPNTDGGNVLTFDIEGSGFYQTIAQNFIPVDDVLFFHFADSVQFIVDAGGEEMYDYYQYTNATLGLTEGQLTTTYTNVTGGLGVFSSRYHKEGKIYPLSIQTVDSVACSSISSGLNFATDESNPGFPYCD